MLVKLTSNESSHVCYRIALYWQGFDRLEMNGPNFAFAVVLLDQGQDGSDHGLDRDRLRQVLDSNGFENVSRFRFALARDPYLKWTLNLQSDNRVGFLSDFKTVKSDIFSLNFCRKD